jgi:hypothetical protein
MIRADENPVIAPSRVRRTFEHKPLNESEDAVERQAQVPQVHRPAEGRTRAGVLPRRAFHRTDLPRARHFRDAAAALARPDGRRRNRVLPSRQDRSLAAEQRRRIVELERALGRKTYQLEIAGKPCLTSYGVSSDPKGRLQSTRTGSVASGRARLTTDDVTPGVDEACGAPHRPPLVSLQGKPRASRANLRCSQAPKVA